MKWPNASFLNCDLTRKYLWKFLVCTLRKEHEDWLEPGSYCLKHVNNFKVLFVQMLSAYGYKLFSSFLFTFYPSKPRGRATMTKRNWGRSKQTFLSSFSILIRVILCQTPLESWASPHTWCITLDCGEMESCTHSGIEGYPRTWVEYEHLSHRQHTRSKNQGRVVPYPNIMAMIEGSEHSWLIILWKSQDLYVV